MVRTLQTLIGGVSVPHTKTPSENRRRSIYVHEVSGAGNVKKVPSRGSIMKNRSLLQTEKPTRHYAESYADTTFS